jgi:hypothetical protein
MKRMNTNKRINHGRSSTAAAARSSSTSSLLLCLAIFASYQPTAFAAESLADSLKNLPLHVTGLNKELSSEPSASTASSSSGSQASIGMNPLKSNASHHPGTGPSAGVTSYPSNTIQTAAGGSGAEEDKLLAMAYSFKDESILKYIKDGQAARGPGFLNQEDFRKGLTELVLKVMAEKKAANQWTAEMQANLCLECVINAPRIPNPGADAKAASQITPELEARMKDLTKANEALTAKLAEVEKNKTATVANVEKTETDSQIASRERTEREDAAARKKETDATNKAERDRKDKEALAQEKKDLKEEKEEKAAADKVNEDKKMQYQSMMMLMTEYMRSNTATNNALIAAGQKPSTDLQSQMNQWMQSGAFGSAGKMFGNQGGNGMFNLGSGGSGTTASAFRAPTPVTPTVYSNQAATAAARSLVMPTASSGPAAFGISPVFKSVSAAASAPRR